MEPLPDSLLDDYLLPSLKSVAGCGYGSPVAYLTNNPPIDYLNQPNTKLPLESVQALHVVGSGDSILNTGLPRIAPIGFNLDSFETIQADDGPSPECLGG